MHALLLLVLFCAGAVNARGDESTRRVQEELRKRNLFFGDVDGRRTPPFVAALRHYQERKGFSPSGEADEQTLRSLDLPLFIANMASYAPPPASATVSNPNPDRSSASASTSTAAPAAATVSAMSPSQPDTSAPYWPDTPVLRSDEARRTSSDPAAAGAFSRIVPNAGDPISPPARFNSVPAPTFTADQAPSAADVKDFITRYLLAGQSNDAAKELDFYGGSVDYFNQGKVDRDFILQDIRRYDKRWPARSFAIVGPVNAVADANNLNHTLVRFRYRFANKNGSAAASGEMEALYTLSGGTPESLRLIRLRERRVR